ncbi:MAG: protein kinase [Gemmatimonadetes bacterium]|nr:protein kinase [Gemmatimonadota bacterium]
MTDVLERLKQALADRYALERELGRGGMATVYLAEDLKHKRKVAIKVLHPELAATLGPDRFLREIEIAAGLQHPHILPLYDSGHAEGFLYYVMPFIEGQSLRARLNKEGALPIAEAARILRDVADALAHAHERKLVHRDIKPDNVMMSGRHAMVTDFGVAKAVSEASGRHNLTTAGVALGTPAYMAPEQAAAEPNLDHRVDIYALGAMAYELLTGHPPFEKGSAAATLAAQVTEVPRPVTEQRGTVPAPLAQLVMKCLEKRPADRWQKADELVSQLEMFTTPSTGITPTDTRPMSGASLGRWRWKVGIPVSALLAALLWMGRNKLPVLRAAPDEKVPVWIALLPFENLGKPQDEFFADGIADAIHGDISKVPGFLVKGLGTSMRYKGTSLSLGDIGSELAVDYLLTARVQWDGQARESSKVRVSAELVRVQDQSTVWQQSYEKLYQDIFAVQREIAERTTAAIWAVIGSPARPAPVQPPAPSTSPKAHIPYLMGRDELVRGRPNFAPAAVRYARQALAMDSTYAPAWALLAEGMMTAGASLDSVLAVSRRAVRVDSNSAEAHTALGRALFNEWQFDEGLTELRKAVSLDRSYGWALGFLGFYLPLVGAAEEGLPLAKRAEQIDPAFWLDASMHALLALKRYGDMIRLADTNWRTDSLNTADASERFRGFALLEMGRGDDALAAFQRSEGRGAARGRSRPSGLHDYGWVYARLNRVAEARALLEKHLAAVKQDPGEQLDIAQLYANLGRPDSAMLWLNRMYERHAGGLLSLSIYPQWNPLRSRPDFVELLRRIGLQT